MSRYTSHRPGRWRVPIFGSITAVILFACAVQAADVPDVTLINGVQVKGRVVAVEDDGLVVQAGQARKTYPWYALSAGTRYRYDQKYRMNIEGYLAGDDPSKLTRPPDPGYDPMSPAAGVSDDEANTSEGSLPFDYNAYPAAPEFVPKDVPALSVVSLEGVSVSALQYGPDEDDVLLSGFTSDEPPGLILLDKSNPRIIREDATTRSIGGTAYYSYPRVSLSSRVADVAVSQRLQWLVRQDRPDRRYVHIEVDLSRGSQESSFVLTGRPRGFGHADETVAARATIVEPAMSFTITIEGEATFLVGKVRLGRLSLLPRAGMDLTLRLTMQDASGRVVVQEDLSFEADGQPGDYALKQDISKLEPGGRYMVSASIDLGAFLGNVMHEEILIMPDALKL